MQSFLNRFQAFWAIKTLRILSIIAVVFAIFLSTLPLALEYTTAYVLKRSGATTAHVENIDLNLFTGRLKIQDLQFQVDDHPSAKLGELFIDLHMLDLMKAEIHVQDSHLQGIALKLSQNKDQIDINGLILPTQGSPESDSAEIAVEETTTSPPVIKIDRFELNNFTFTYQQPEFSKTANLQQLLLENLDSEDKELPAGIIVKAQIDRAEIDLNSNIQAFTATPKADGRLNLHDLRLEDYSAFFPDDLKKLTGRLSFNTDFKVVLKGDLPEVEADSKITLFQLDAVYRNLSQQLGQLEWKGKSRFDGQNVSISGDLFLEENKTHDLQQNFELLAFKRFDLSGLSFEEQTIKLNNSTISGLSTLQLEGQRPLADIKSISVDDIQRSANGDIEVALIEISKPILTAELDNNASLPQTVSIDKTLQQLVPATESAVEETEVPQDSENMQAADKPQLSIGKITLLEPGAIHFTDNSVSPIFTTDLHLKTITIESINQLQPANFKLHLQQGDYTQIEIDGAGLLFDPTRQLSVNSKISRLDLPPVTPYSSQSLGYGLKTGTVDADISATLKERNIDGLSKVTLDSIEVVETNKETAEKVSSASGMSIDLALSTLKDDNNEIYLEVPIKGNLDEPDFDFSQIINTAMGKAMRTASLSYLKHALQPFGSLITLVSLVNAAANHISLPPILFTVNSLDLNEDQQELLQKVKNLMQERPQLKLKVCGIASLADKRAIEDTLLQKMIADQQAKDSSKPEEKTAEESKTNPDQVLSVDPKAVQQALSDLANARASKIKKSLIEEAGVESKRLLNCLSTTNLDEDSQSSVELAI